MTEAHEIRITSSGKEKNYIGYALKILGDKSCETIILSGMGSAITKTISIAEILKRKVPGLHQWTRIESHEVEVNFFFLFFFSFHLTTTMIFSERF